MEVGRVSSHTFSSRGWSWGWDMNVVMEIFAAPMFGVRSYMEKGEEGDWMAVKGQCWNTLENDAGGGMLTTCLTEERIEGKGGDERGCHGRQTGRGQQF